MAGPGPPRTPASGAGHTPRRDSACYARSWAQSDGPDFAGYCTSRLPFSSAPDHPDPAPSRVAIAARRVWHFAPAPPTPSVPQRHSPGATSRTRRLRHTLRRICTCIPQVSRVHLQCFQTSTHLAKCHLAQKLRIHTYRNLSFLKIDPSSYNCW